MNKIDKYLDESVGDKTAEVKITFKIPRNIKEDNMKRFIEKKFSAAIKQGGVVKYDIKVF